MDRIRSADKFHQVVKNMMRSQTPNSCRELANGLGINKMTAWRWRKRVMEALTGIGDTCLDGIVEADEKFFRESRKGSREWVNHERDPMAYPAPPRPQWYDYDAKGLPKPRGRSRWQMSVLTMTDRSGNRRADRLPSAFAKRLKALLSQHIAPHAILCSDGEQAYDQFAQQKGILHHRIYAKKGPRVIQNTFHIQTINNIHRRFEDFMRPFCGPATNNLSSYTAWFLARDREQ